MKALTQASLRTGSITGRVIHKNFCHFVPMYILYMGTSVLLHKAKSMNLLEIFVPEFSV